MTEDDAADSAVGDATDGAVGPAAAELAAEIRRLRIAAGLSQKELAAQVGYTRQYVSLAERTGGNLPSLELVRALDTRLNADGHLLALREHARHVGYLRRSALMAEVSLANESTGRSRHVHIPDLVNVDNRNASNLSAVLAEDLARERDRVESIVRGANTTDLRAVSAVADGLATLRRMEDVTSATAVRPLVLQQANLLTLLAENAAGKVRVEAIGLLSEFHQYLGWLNMPEKNWSVSQSHLDRAAILALEANDPQRLSTALSFMSYKSLRRDDLSNAAAMNEAASRDARTHVGQRTYLAFQRAEVYAKAGDRSAALSTLSDADVLVDQLPEESDLPSSGYWYTPAFFHGQRAFVLHALGDKVQARNVAAEALASLPDAWRVSEWASRRRKLAEMN